MIILEVPALLVGAAVFKTVGLYEKHAVGGFDSHALPFLHHLRRPGQETCGENIKGWRRRLPLLRGQIFQAIGAKKFASKQRRDFILWCQIFVRIQFNQAECQVQANCPC